MYCFYMYCNVLYQLLLLPLFIRLFNYLFIHKDCLDAYYFSIFLSNMHLML